MNGRSMGHVGPSTMLLCFLLPYSNTVERGSPYNGSLTRDMLLHLTAIADPQKEPSIQNCGKPSLARAALKLQIFDSWAAGSLHACECAGMEGPISRTYWQ